MGKWGKLISTRGVSSGKENPGIIAVIQSVMKQHAEQRADEQNKENQDKLETEKEKHAMKFNAIPKKYDLYRGAYIYLILDGMKSTRYEI